MQRFRLEGATTTPKTKPPQFAGVIVCYVKPRLHYIVATLAIKRLGNLCLEHIY